MKKVFIVLVVLILFPISGFTKKITILDCMLGNSKFCDYVGQDTEDLTQALNDYRKDELNYWKARADFWKSFTTPTSSSGCNKMNDLLKKYELKYMTTEEIAICECWSNVPNSSELNESYERLQSAKENVSQAYQELQNAEKIFHMNFYTSEREKYSLLFNEQLIHYRTGEHNTELSEAILQLRKVEMLESQRRHRTCIAE